jgi:hypothetical protein
MNTDVLTYSSAMVQRGPAEAANATMDGMNRNSLW